MRKGSDHRDKGEVVTFYSDQRSSTGVETYDSVRQYLLGLDQCGERLSKAMVHRHHVRPDTLQTVLVAVGRLRVVGLRL